VAVIRRPSLNWRQPPNDTQLRAVEDDLKHLTSGLVMAWRKTTNGDDRRAVVDRTQLLSRLEYAMKKREKNNDKQTENKPKSCKTQNKIIINDLAGQRFETVQVFPKVFLTVELHP